MKPSVTILGIAQDGGVPQCGCACERCMSAHNGKSDELYPVSLGLVDCNGGFHIIEASRLLCKQLRLWATVMEPCTSMSIISPIQSVTITHAHLGHIDGIGLFGKEAMGSSGVRLYSNKHVLHRLERCSMLNPFVPFVVENEQIVSIGPGISIEFCRVPHRDFEIGETHAVVCRGPSKSFLFLPDHDTWTETLSSQKHNNLRSWLHSLRIDFALIDGTFFTHDELSDTRTDFRTIPHPPILESLNLLGSKQENDPDIYFIHINHSNPVLSDVDVEQRIRGLGWHIARQGMILKL